jgi:hypothetical protein
MNPQLNYILAQQRMAELQRAGERAQLASKLRRARNRAAQMPQHERDPWVTRFTLRRHHIAKLDRFVSQAQRAALRAEREFDGVRLEVDAEGVVTVHAIGMTSMLL